MTKKIELMLPLKDIYITQKFGLNYLDFYKKLGLAGHNGIDLRAKDGCPVTASHGGYVEFAGRDSNAGVSVVLVSEKIGYGIKTIYYHLKSVNVATGEKVKVGSLIGWADNTGKYTTGSHLHLGLKETLDGETTNRNNGYFGAIDPSPYFPENWDKSNAWHRYGRRRNWGSYQNEIKVMVSLIRYLKRLPTHEEINACTYGGWSREAVANPAMKYNWAYLKKSEFKNGKIPFN